MNDEAKRKYKEDLVKEAARIMEEVNADPNVANVPAPVERMRENIFREIRAREAIKEKEAKENLSAEDKELIRLGTIYKKRRKRRKYFVLAAAVICVMAIGITSIGENEKIFETFKIITMGRDQTQINSNENVREETNWSEDKVYEEIESKYGFYPVKLNYLPERIEFQEASIGNEIQDISLIYGHNDKVDIIFNIRPNYRSASLGIDIEDSQIQNYQMTVQDVEMIITQYIVEETGENRWATDFVYQDVQYSIQFFEMEQEKVEEILNNLYFV